MTRLKFYLTEAALFSRFGDIKVSDEGALLGYRIKATRKMAHGESLRYGPTGERKGETEHYIVCLNCGCEYHGYPDFAEPLKCGRCGGIKFQRMTRETIPLKDWKRPGP